MLLCIACKALKTIKSIAYYASLLFFYLKEPFQLKYFLSFAFILGAVYFVFKNKKGSSE